MDDASRGRVGRTEPEQPEAMPADQRAMVLDAVDRRVLTVAVGMEAVAAVRGDQLQRIASRQVRTRSLPGRDISVERRPLGIVGGVPLEQLGDELQLAAGCLQARAEFFGELRRQGMRL